ncbi:hypothetical protein SHKM778_92440 [Streptomyces sp. KM77-8]|uniref:Uncharacterized protein n=1 Tax=Streptomyces haneummycinicus TaxID=3074435 RepID=A0AAT9HZ56_9ACTN
MPVRLLPGPRITVRLGGAYDVVGPGQTGAPVAALDHGDARVVGAGHEIHGEPDRGVEGAVGVDVSCKRCAADVSASARSNPAGKRGKSENRDAATTNLFGMHGTTAVRRRAPQHIPDCEQRTHRTLAVRLR